ncbi:adenylate/guanylate cyclase domain-containing protein [Roseibium sp.]|uniref:adenylate/guanylate cyclase domain-containing protein n=1 Tax=Roseibium sp. TaxID=1936156 RepID=UPI003D0F712F
MTIENWLTAIGMERYADAFRENGIDTDILGELEDADLREIGVSLGDRKRILKAVRGEETSTEPVPGASAALPAAASQAERRHLTVMFLDLVGSTRLSAELDPEDMRDVIRLFQKIVTEEVQHLGGYVAKYMGDGVLVYFGFPVASEHDAEAAVSAGLNLCKRLAETPSPGNATLMGRVGIATGLVVVGDLVGSQEARERDVIGETPNLAARLQTVAWPGRVVISENTRELLGNLFEVEPIENLEIKGFSEGVTAYRVVGKRQFESRFAVQHGGKDIRMIGREGEFSVLEDRWDLACKGRGQVVSLTGEAGIGKSLFASSLKKVVAAENGTSLELQCSPHHLEDPLHPFLQLVRQLAAISPQDSPAVTFARFSELFGSTDGDGTIAAQLVARFMRLGLDHTAPVESAPQQLLNQTIKVISDLIISLSAGAPLFIIVEDVQWIDPTSFDALQRFFAAMERQRILVLMTSRPGANLPRAGTLGTTSLALEPLDRIKVAEIVQQLAGKDALPERLISQIAEKADGIPLFVEELTKTVLHSDVIERGETGERPGEADREISVPSSLHDTLMARLDRIPNAKHVAQHAACFGRIFDRSLLQKASGVGAAELENALAELIKAGVIHETADEAGEVFTFSHGLVSDIARGSLLKSELTRFHGRIADVLDEDGAEPEKRAYYRERADQPCKAATLLLEAARNRLQVSAAKEAVNYLTRGITLIDPLPATPEINQLRFRLQAFLGTSYMVLRSWGADEVERCYTEALSLSDAATDIAEKLWIIWGIWVFRQVRGEIGKCGEEIERITRIATDSGDPDTLVVARMAQLQNAFYQGEVAEAARLAAETYAVYDPARHDALKNAYSVDLLLVAQIHAAQALWIMGRLKEAEALTSAAEARCASVAHTHSRIWGTLWGANYHLLRGNHRRILEIAPDAIRSARELGFEYAESLGRMILASARIAVEATPEDVDDLEEAIARFRSTGAGITVPYFSALLAEGRSRLGQDRTALELIETSLSNADSLGERWHLPLALRILGDILSAPGFDDFPGALDAYDRAITTAESQGARYWQVQAQLAKARLTARKGRIDTARDLVASAARNSQVVAHLTGQKDMEAILTSFAQ